jgi:hypothetical protein
VETDDYGAYWALEHGREYTGPWLAICKAIADVWWIFLWILTIQTLRAFRSWQSDDRMFLTMSVAIVPEVLFMVFIAAVRYHVPMVPSVVCLAVYAVSTGLGFAQSPEAPRESLHAATGI